MKTFSREEDLQRVFDAGEESILDYADMSTMRKPNQESPRQVLIDIEDGTAARLDRFASRYGMTRQALIETWLVERMDEGSVKILAHFPTAPRPAIRCGYSSSSVTSR